MLIYKSLFSCVIVLYSVIIIVYARATHISRSGNSTSADTPTYDLCFQMVNCHSDFFVTAFVFAMQKHAYNLQASCLTHFRLPFRLFLFLFLKKKMCADFVSAHIMIKAIGDRFYRNSDKVLKIPLCVNVVILECPSISASLTISFCRE